MNDKCKNKNCLPCRWWPKIVKMLGKEAGCYWVDEVSGELMIATGLRVLPSGVLVQIESDECPSFYETECECGNGTVIRGDLLERNLSTRCPECAASLTHTMRN